MIALRILSQGINNFISLASTYWHTQVNVGFYVGIIVPRGSGSSVGITTELRAGRSGIESRWGRDFPPVQTGPGAHSASRAIGTGPNPGAKCGRGVLLTTYPLLVPRSWKSRALSLPTLWATPGLLRDHFPFTKAIACEYSIFLFCKYKVTIPNAGETAVMFNNVIVLRCLSRAD